MRGDVDYTLGVIPKAVERFRAISAWKTDISRGF